MTRKITCKSNIIELCDSFFFLYFNLYFDSCTCCRKEVKGNWERACEAMAILSQTLLERESLIGGQIRNFLIYR